MEILVNNWQKEITETTLKDSVILSFTRKAVAELNLQAREALQEKNIIGNENIEFQGFEKKLQISRGERLLFRQNDRTLNVRNGDLGIVQSVEPNAFSIKLDSGELLRIPREYRAIDYGYALTVHKSQGMTVENSHVLIDSKYWDRNLSFVAMTRHRENLKIYADKINHPDLKALKNTLSRSVTRDNVIDWPLDFGIHRGFSPDNMAQKAVSFMVDIKNPIRNCGSWLVNYESRLNDSRENAREFATNQDKQQEKAMLEMLKTKYPALAKYDELRNKSSRMTGYFREKMERCMQELARTVLKDPRLARNLQGSLLEQVKKQGASLTGNQTGIQELGR